MDVLSALVDEVEEAVTEIMKQAESVTGLKDMLNQAIAPLRDGGWTGKGAQAFFNAADTELLKTTETLGTSILGLGSSVRGALELIKEADAMASTPLNGIESAIDSVKDFFSL